MDSKPLVIKTCQLRVNSARLPCKKGEHTDHIIELQIITSIYCGLFENISLRHALEDFQSLADYYNDVWNLQCIEESLNLKKGISFDTLL